MGGGLCRLRDGGGFSGFFISTIDREAGPIIYFIFMVGSSEVKMGERGWTWCAKQNLAELVE